MAGSVAMIQARGDGRLKTQLGRYNRTCLERQNSQDF